MKTKSTIKIRQIDIKKIKLLEGKFSALENVEPTIISTSENLFYHTLFRIQGKAFPPVYLVKTGYTLDVFILKAEMIKDTEKNQKKRKLYAKLMEKGIYIGDVHYLRTICSVSMKRDQRTMFVRAELKQQLDEYLSLGKNKTISKTIISKYEASIGLSLSSGNLIEDKPYIVVIPDCFKTIIEDVLQVRNYRETPEDVAENERIKWMVDEEAAKYEYYKVKNEEAKLLNTQEAIAKQGKSERWSQKSKTKWAEEGRYVKADELSKPKAYTEFDEVKYPAYSIDQTEEKVYIPLTPFSVGKELVPIKNHGVKTNLFDGMGICSFEWAERMSKELELNEVSNAFQYRDMMQKGLLIRFDFKTYFPENGVFFLRDIWGTEHHIDHIDLIMSESQFKQGLEKGRDDEKIFSSIEDYQNLKEHYDFKHIVVCAVAKPIIKMNPYIQTAYQHLQAFNLNKKELFNLSLPTTKLAKELVNGQNIMFMKAYLGMYPNEDEADYELRDYFAEALDIHHQMQYDPHMRKYLAGQAKYIVEDIFEGKLYVRGAIHYVACDLIAFAEWAMYQNIEKVSGFLNQSEFFANGKEGRYVGVRNPCTHFSEVVKMDYVSTDNKWVQHLDNITQLNAYDLSALRAGGCDFDGDTFSIYDNEILLRNVINSDVVIPCTNEAPESTAKPLNIQSLVEYELFSLANETGVITNIGTTFANQSNEQNKGNPTQYSFECAISKILQGDIIDSQKSQIPVFIPEVLKETAKYKPYFMINIDFGSPKSYQSREYAHSPLNSLVIKAEDWLHKIFNVSGDVNRDECDDYLNPSRKTYTLLKNESKYDKGLFNTIIQGLQPVYNYWMVEKEKIEDKYNLKGVTGKDNRKEVGKQRRKAYGELNKELVTRAVDVYCDPSVLASAAVQISYYLTKYDLDNNIYARNDNFGFCWTIASEGIIDNLKINEDDRKQDLLEFKSLNHRLREFGGKSMKVSNHVGIVDGEKMETILPDGIYKIRCVLGKHFIEVDSIRKVKIVDKSCGIMDMPNIEVLPVRNHMVKLVSMNMDKTTIEWSEVIEELDLHLKMNEKGYLALYDSDERYIGSVAPDYVDRLDINLMDYIGERVLKVENVDKSNKTITIKMDIL